MITNILSRVMGGGGRRSGGGTGAPGRSAGRAGSSKDAAVGRGVRSLFRRVR
ncbi:MAG: hypothetical protein Q8Q02_11540 [Nocardioides sp.]|nr:hypothetical protein [Nocardioides sp.]